MKFPSTKDFYDVFNINPVEEDPTMAYCRYVKSSEDGFLEMDVSFSAVAESFQIVLKCNSKDVVTISSEKARLVELQQDQAGSRVHVLFDIDGVVSEAVATLHPHLHCHWWTLRN